MGLGAGQIALDVDFDEVEKASSQKPIVRLVQSSGQSLADNTAIALTFTSESIDTDGFFSAGVSQTRITPTKAGYYRVKGSFIMQGSATYVNLFLFVRKNGSTGIPPGARLGGLSATGAPTNAIVAAQATVNCEVFVDMNGTTDYLELIAQHDTTQNIALSTSVSGAYSPTFELEYMRSL